MWRWRSVSGRTFFVLQTPQYLHHLSVIFFLRSLGPFFKHPDKKSRIELKKKWIMQTNPIILPATVNEISCMEMPTPKHFDKTLPKYSKRCWKFRQCGWNNQCIFLLTLYISVPPKMIWNDWNQLHFAIAKEGGQEGDRIKKYWIFSIWRWFTASGSIWKIYAIFSTDRPI